MKRRTLVETDHSKISWSVKNILKFSEVYGMELQFKLADRMAERNLTVRALSSLSGLRLATINDIMNGNRSSINFQHLTILMITLRLTKVSDLIDIYLPDFMCDMYEEESAEWIATGEPPTTIQKLKFLHTIQEEQQDEYIEILQQHYVKQEEMVKKLKADYEAKKKGSN